ncbi:MAG: hypothetical protein SVK54_09070 [candidate division WOR-3 bacterium]|nr:hypothetical protein [candidate division WOR-3 bacterium]
MGKSINNLCQIISQLSPDQRDLIESIYTVRQYNAGTGINADFPKDIVRHIAEGLGTGESETIALMSRQNITRVYNNIEKRGALFNSIRTARPGIKGTESAKREIMDSINRSAQDCDFCNPLSRTPADPFGRIAGKYCVTSANIARYDRFSSLIIFNRHNPLEFTENEMTDYLETADNWFKKVYEYDSDYQYPFLFWNCLSKAAASKSHGHMQILMASERPYSGLMNFINNADNYNNGRNYLKDLSSIYETLGLITIIDGFNVITLLTPVKEKEIIIFPKPGIKADPGDFAGVLYRLLRIYIDKMHVYSFNMALFRDDYINSRLPYIARIVDRGNPLDRRSDIGGMELWAEPVIGTDPYRLIEAIKEENDYEE